MTQTLINKLREFFSTQPVEKAWLFGSYSRGEETENSDIDILVKFAKDIPLGMKYFRMVSELENLCSTRVDLVEEDMLDVRVQKYVNSDRILIYERGY
ncbi:MAG: nucleotidyltransferase domain-containing protein [Muribaculaceae bacterium]|nr:nucleotidyltransferase domain-containing protein [Muribaculaceae bacterium]